MAYSKTLHNLVLAAAYQRKGDVIRATKAFALAAASDDFAHAAKLVQAYNEKQTIKAGMEADMADPGPGSELREEPDENTALREIQEADLATDLVDMGLEQPEDDIALELSAADDEEDDKGEDDKKDEPFGGKKAPPFGSKDDDKKDDDEDKKDEKSSVKVLSAVDLATLRFRRALTNVNAMNELAAKKAKDKKKAKPMPKGKK